MSHAGVLVILATLLAAAIAPESSSWTNAAPVATPGFDVLGETPGSVPLSVLIENRGDAADRLVGGTTPVAARIEVHHARLDDGVRVMLPALNGLEIPPGNFRVFEPESGHLMLIGLTEDLVQGETFPLTLHFANAGDVTVSVRVRRKVDAAGIPKAAPAVAGEIAVSLASAPPAPAAP